VIDARLATLGILAGGQARRIGGRDKARLVIDGRMQVERVLAAFPQPFHERLLSYNRDPQGLPGGLRIVPDARADFPGPVAALEALAAACRTPWLLTVPIDCRDVPPTLFAALASAVKADGATLDDADGVQPLVGLWFVESLRPACAALLDAGNAPARRLRERLHLRIVDIAPHRLGNLNTDEDLERP
jgi:molybdopterin-guanine dinucleotide biosynthesis protein A